MGTGVDDLDAEPAEMVLGLLVDMVFRSIEQQHGVLPELRPVLTELDGELGQIQLHDIGIGTDLSEAEIDVALGVYGRYQRDPRNDLLAGHSIGGARLAPLADDVLEAGDPGLIDVEDALLLLHELQHAQRKLLAEDEVPIDIASMGELLAALVLEAHV